VQAEPYRILLDQYRSHPSWSCQLHRDNLVALAQQQPQLAPVPSYSVVRRFMKAHGLVKRPRRGRGDTAGSRAAEQRFECFEVGSYEVSCAHQLWHLDFHSGSLKVLLPDGQWVHPKILGILDDLTRLCVHAQWYLAETAENLIHGLSQALQYRRRGTLPKRTCQRHRQPRSSQAKFRI
jgi:putative transposase